jgi:hypothetical protein
MSDDDLRRRVRDALAADEPRHAPSFDRLWSNAHGGDANAASRRPFTRAPLYGAVAVAIVLAGGAWLLRGAVRDGVDRAAESTPVAAADDDYRLATQLAATFDRPSPIDRLTAGLPSSSLARGLPDISEYRYPLLPEEVPL